MSWLRRRSRVKSPRLRGLLRAGAYVVTLSLFLSAFQLRAAHAELSDRSMDLGRQMMQLANASDHDVNKVVLNGQAMWVGSSVAKDSASAVLDRYQAECAKNAAQPASGWRELAQQAEKADTQMPAIGSGILRSGDRNEGAVLCFTRGGGSKPTVKEALKAFASTGELGALGNLRYVYVRTAEQGDTIVLTAWTDDKFNIADLVVDENADAPGSDFPEIPRPPSSNRILAAQVEGTPFGLNIYRSKEGPATVVAFFDAEMQKHGWFALDPELGKQNPGDTTQVVGRAYERDGVVLTLASNLQDGDTITGLGLAGVTSTDGTSTASGVKASDDLVSRP